MKHKQRNLNQKAVFDSLVLNAIDFFKKSITETKKDPKYSVIDFCSAIELFMKARLMLEHWSLIINKPELANKDKFMSGDFQSVSMDGALDRLESVAGQTLQPDNRSCFNRIREHRNKLVHFYHKDYSGQSQPNTIQNIVSEQCKGWYYLHRLLTNDWKKEFSRYSSEIKELDKLMLKQRHFLSTKYDLLAKTINDDKTNGIDYFKCFSCGFPSLKQTVSEPPLMERQCLVCNAYSSALKVVCPKCEKSIFVEDMGEGQCEHCKEQINIDYLLDVFDSSDHAYCSECENTSTPTVVKFGGKWLCLSCLTFHNEVNTCDWCSELCTGTLEDSYFAGCAMCEGKAAELENE